MLLLYIDYSFFCSQTALLILQSCSSHTDGVARHFFFHLQSCQAPMPRPVFKLTSVQLHQTGTFRTLYRLSYTEFDHPWYRNVFGNTQFYSKASQLMIIFIAASSFLAAVLNIVSQSIKLVSGFQPDFFSCDLDASSFSFADVEPRAWSWSSVIEGSRILPGL